jgi:hypothetical protein
MSLDLWLYKPVDVGATEAVVWTFGNFNYTHNVVPMWLEAGVYTALYESFGHLAVEYLEVLAAGIADMETRPDVYRQLNPANGWGDYDTALPWLRRWWEACCKYPQAFVGSSK